MQADLFSTVTWFRTQKYAMTADTERVYHQIKMNPTGANLKRILWRENMEQPLNIQKLEMVTYGTACALPCHKNFTTSS
jgi:uncharacterized protein YpiB (UPF0302 family)